MTARISQTLDVFVQERRTTQLYLSLRQCQATDLSTDVGTHDWDHSGCDHSRRLLPTRAAVRSLPDSVVEKVTSAIDQVTMSPRTAGNSDAPGSSSASSELQNDPAEASSPSTPEVTPPEPPTS